MNSSIRYVLRHSARGGGKTILAVILAFMLTSAVGRLDSLRQHYEALSRSVLVQGSVLGGVSVYRAEKLAEAEEVKDYYLEKTIQQCEFTKTDALRVTSTCSLCFTSDCTRVAGAKLEWLEGWDWSSFQQSRERVCLIPQTLAEELEIVPGDRIHIAVAGYGNILYLNHPDIDDPDEIMQLYKRVRPPTTIVGLISGEQLGEKLLLPIHGMELYENAFGDLKVEYAVYTLRDYRDTLPFRERFLTEMSREKGNPSLYLDTAEADRIRKMARLLSTLYPIAMGVALLLGGVLPGLMVLQNSRETAILRVLGMTRRKVCTMLVGEQILLCVIGLVLSITVAIVLGAVRKMVYPAVHLAACLVGSFVFSWVSTRKDLLSLLQAKE